MTPQRCSPYALARVLGATSALFLLGLLLPSRAGAVQIFIESAFVHRINPNCVVENVNGVPRFRCPPIPQSVCCGNTNVCGPAVGICGLEFEGNVLPSVNPCEPGGGVGDSDTVNTCPGSPAPQGFGNISNEPHIEFERQSDADDCKAAFNGFASGTAPFGRGVIYSNVCNSAVFLCGSVGYANTDNGTSTTDVGVDELSFEIFKWQDGSNPLDPASTPPLRTFFVDAPGVLPGNSTSSGPGGPLGPFCVLWDGSVNIQGEFGKTNGQFGFRVQVKTNQTGPSGNITITNVRAYPSGATRDADFFTCPALSTAPGGCIVSQKPLVVDVTNIHVVRSSPTIVGTVTGIPAEPYNLTYRLSKDATTFINITATNPPFGTIRTILPGIVRVGEGTPQGTLLNGDSWNGRADNGDLLSPGVYLADFQAVAQDQFGNDLSEETIRQIGLDPLQITDIRVQPLLEGATSLAVLDYVLTEPATTFIDIYPPGTQFCPKAVPFIPDPLNQVNNPALDVNTSTNPPKDFSPRLDNCAGAKVDPLKRIVEQKSSRTRVVSFWDGRDNLGNLVNDGNYVFVLYAALPSQNGFPFFTNGGDKRIWTSQAKSGFLPVIRGLVGISQVSPASSVIGSSPAIAGLNPFFFRYSLSRDAIVNMRIFDASGSRLVKTLVSNETRPGLFGNVERWDEPVGDNGLVVDSGTYLAQLTAVDPAFPAKVSTTTALFPVDLFRIVDVQASPLLTGASDLILLNYQLSQTMNVGWNIYPPGTVVLGSTNTWPPCGSVTPGSGCAQIVSPSGAPVAPVVSFHGLRAGRLRITEQWDGRDSNGLLVPDGNYVFTLAAESTTTLRHFATDRALGSVAVQRGAIIFPNFSVTPDIPPLFNSSATISLHPFTISYSLTRQSSVTIQILNSGIPPAVVRNVISGQVRQNGILLQDVWDGRDDQGNFPPAGFYTVRAVAQDLASQLSSGSTAQVTISFDPLRIYDVAVTPLRADTPASSILYQVSEPMKVAIKIFRPGTVFDPAGNPAPPESVSLVKRIVGVKSARTAIEDVWDGTDLRLSLVPDGSYKFKIVASTDTKAIDDLTGNVLNPSALSPDRPIDEIPVVRNASLDPAGDFERNTFAFPNPVTGPTATFQIFVPFQARVKMRVYNIAGELILEKDFGERPPSFTSAGQISFAWNKTNQAGRTVARGLYYAVVRIEETLGGKNILQTVKRLLLP